MAATRKHRASQGPGCRSALAVFKRSASTSLADGARDVGRRRLASAVSGVAVALIWALLQPQAAAADDGTTSTVAPAGSKGRGAQAESNVTRETGPNAADGLSSDDQRVNDSYRPKGIQAGGFLVLPKIEAGESYNSNIYAIQTGVKGDMITNVSPQIAVRSQFSEHELNFLLKLDHDLHQTYTRDDRTNFEADVDGRYEFSRESQAGFYTQAYLSHEDRSSPNTVQGVSPTPTQGVINRADIRGQFDRFSLLAEVGADRLTFDNVKTALGTLIPNTDRDRWEFSLRERVAYEMFPGYAAVIQVTENTHVFDQSLDRSGFNRNSSGYRAETGIGVDISKLIRGDFLLGYFQQYYDDSRFKDAGGMSMRAVFNWTPTKDTIVIPAIDRTVTDTTTLNASAFDRSSLTLTVRHEIQRNIIVTGFGGVYYDQLTGVQKQNDITYSARTRLTYSFTPELYLAGELGFMSKQAEAKLQGFDQMTATVRIGVQY